jgi:tyrosyl-tRNA synthetase
MNLFKRLSSRQMLKDFTPISDTFINKSVYCGFDPTASSLHLGHLCTINALVHASVAGFSPIAVLGTATALIGDPSGKSESRPLLDSSTVTSNSQSLKFQILDIYSKICSRIETEAKEIRIVENHVFYEQMNLISFLRNVGLFFPVSPMINREFIQSRKDGVSYTEFSYGLLQAYDFYMLFEQSGCVGQLGGSDQWSNITAGTELIRKKTGKTAFGCTLPLLTTKDGKKFGKTEGNALFFDKNKTKPYDIYQYCFNLPDDDIEKMLYMLTFLDENTLAHSISQPLELRTPQKLLAMEIIETIHGKEEASKVQRISEILFNDEYKSVFYI